MKFSIINFFLIIVLSMGLNIPGIADAHKNAPDRVGFQLLSEDDSGVTLQYTLESYQFTKIQRDGNIYDRIEMMNSGRLEEAGKASLPMVVASLGVPANGEFTLEILEVQAEPISGKFYIEPSGSYVAGEGELSAGTLKYIPDSAFYSSGESYPANHAELGEDYWMRDQRILPVRIFPFQYTPNEGKITALRSITVRINFSAMNVTKSSGVPSGSSSPEKNDPFDEIFRENLINYDQSKSYRSQAIDSFDTSKFAASEAVQSTHPRYKIAITEDGIYRLTYEALQGAGVPVDTINPQTFAMTNQGRKVAIYVDDSGGNPTSFQPGEFILFYGEHFDGSYLASLYTSEASQWRNQFITPSNTLAIWSPQFNHYMVEKYTRTNVYWLEYDTLDGLFMSTQTVAPGTATVPASFREKVRAERDLDWRTTHFTSEDTFFWERVRSLVTITKTYTTTLSSPLVSGTDAVLKGEFVGYAHSTSVNPDHRQKIYFNLTPSDRVPIADIVWDGLIRYEFNTTFSASKMQEGINSISVNFIKQTGIVAEDVLVNWFEIEYDRQFIAVDNQLIFTGDQAGTWKYEISGFSTSHPWLLDITESLTPTLLVDSSFVGDLLSFEITHDSGEKFIAANAKDISSSQIQSYIPPANLKEPADYLIITHPDFITASQAIADYRQTHDGLTSRVVNVQDLYNEYNYGIFHPIAIKNFLYDVYHSWETPPTYVLLIGDGNWNFLSSTKYDILPIYLPPNLQWVDPWQGEVDSSNLLAAVNGDDPIPDILIGRLPVTNSSQISGYLQKVILHESQLSQTWQSKHIFITDEPDPMAGDFPLLSQGIINSYLSAVQNPKWFYLDSGHTTYDTHYASDIPCTPSGTRLCWNATSEIINLLNSEGGGLVNYTGHGAINIWTKSTKLFTNEDIPNFANSQRHPIILSWTCLDGYWIYPKASADYSSKTGQSMIEELIRLPNYGIVGAFSPTGLGVSTGHDTLQRGFYDYIFQQQQPWRLGYAALAGKIRLYSDSPRDVDLVHTYTVFGDPALLTAPSELNLFVPVIMK